MPNDLIPTERIADKIYILRGKKVILDRDLAVLYGVPTKVLNQAIRRNPERFPDDFMLKLTLIEHESLRSQIVTSNVGRGGQRRLSHAFTEQGVAMLSSVLRSPRAVMVNIQIIRTFTRLRELLADNEHLRLKLEAMEARYDKNFKVVFDAIRLLLKEGDEPKTEIGFRAED